VFCPWISVICRHMAMKPESVRFIGQGHATSGSTDGARTRTPNSLTQPGSTLNPQCVDLPAGD